MRTAGLALLTLVPFLIAAVIAHRQDRGSPGLRHSPAVSATPTTIKERRR